MTAYGDGQRVVASTRDHRIEVVVSDSGPGIANPLQRPTTHGQIGLSLVGLRRRIEASHGSLDIISLTDGTHVVAKKPFIAHQIKAAAVTKFALVLTSSVSPDLLSPQLTL